MRFEINGAAFVGFMLLCAAWWSDVPWVTALIGIVIIVWNVRWWSEPK